MFQCHVAVAGDISLLVEIAAAVGVFVGMAGLYVFILRGTSDSLGKNGNKRFSNSVLSWLAGNRDGPEFISGLLAVLCLASLTAETGADLAGPAGAGVAVLVFACRVSPLRTMVKLPVHAMYSAFGILGALAAAKDYLFPADPESGGSLLLRWVLLALVWSFTTLGTFVGFTTGKVDWKLGLLLFGSTEIVVYLTVPLEDQLDNPWILVGALLAATFLGVVSTMVRFRDYVEITAAVVILIGSVALTSAEQGIARPQGVLEMTGPMISMILTFVIVYAVLRGVSKRFLKTPMMGRKS